MMVLITARGNGTGNGDTRQETGTHNNASSTNKLLGWLACPLKCGSSGRLGCYWEGPRGVKDLCAVCRTFGLGVAMHSGAEFGVELAAMLHTASTIPPMHAAGDAHYHYLEDDIIEGGKLPYVDGAIRVPDGPGLGVALDEEKMARYQRYYEEHGDYYARFHQDPRRPDWTPNVGGVAPGDRGHQQFPIDS